MRIRTFLRAHFLLLAGVIFTLSTPAHAQRDIGDVLGGIFGSGPVQGQPLPGQIETIPVDVRYDFKDVYPGLPPEASLIVTAYAPPPANVRRTHPLMIGETRLLLSDLKPPLQVVIAAPSSVTRDIPYARIEARIVDGEGHVLLEATRSGEYRGRRPARMVLDKHPNTTQGSVPPQTPRNPQAPPNPVRMQTLHGSAIINGRTPDLRGATLIVQLVEDSLAGGTKQTIYGEKRVALDRKTPPFNFEILTSSNGKAATPPKILKAWITDWAGRKILELPSPVPYTGPNFDYHLVFEAAHGVASPNPSPVPTPNGATLPVQGRVEFNAWKGLPAGSQLLIDLERMDYRALPAQIASKRLPVDARTGTLDFTLDVPRTDMDPNLPTPRLRVRIIDPAGRILFSNPGGTPVQNGLNTIKLRAAPNY